MKRLLFVLLIMLFGCSRIVKEEVVVERVVDRVVFIGNDVDVSEFQDSIRVLEGRVLELESDRYVVQSGDCLWYISERFLGSGYRWFEIYLENRDRILDSALIYPGQILKVSCGMGKMGGVL